jgi:hypothetical protein
MSSTGAAACIDRAMSAFFGAGPLEQRQEHLWTMYNGWIRDNPNHNFDQGCYNRIKGLMVNPDGSRRTMSPEEWHKCGDAWSWMLIYAARAEGAAGLT